VSQINEGDRALRELIGAAYYPGTVREGEPASGERQTFVPGIFGNIFDVLVATNNSSATTSRLDGRSFNEPAISGRQSEPPGVSPGYAPINKSLSPARGDRSSVTTNTRSPMDAIDSYRAIIVGGRIDWSPKWIQKLTSYVRDGGIVVLNSAQIKGLPSDLLGVRLTGTNGESHNARCLSPGEQPQDLGGQIFRYEQVELKGAEALIATPSDSPLVTVNKVRRGKIIFVAVPDLLGEDERLTPFAAHLLAHLATDATPIKVEGDVEYLINRNSRGWVVTLFNDNGVFKPQQGLAQVDRSASVTVKVSLKGQGIASAGEWTSDRNLSVIKRAGNPDSVSVNIAPGGIAVVELIAAR